MLLGIHIPDYVGIGDRIQFGCLPENFYLNTGDKMVDVSDCYVFDHNPFVIRNRNVSPDRVVNLWVHKWEPSPNFLSKSERWCDGLGLETCFLRHPRLYIYEDVPTQSNLITVHTSGKMKGTFSDKIIDQIHKNYQGYDIVQVGGKDDKGTPFTDRRGLNFFESANLIAQSQIFIGPSSGMYHISRCYPKVRKKVVVLDSDGDLDRETLKTFSPYKLICDDWLDFDTEIYNESKYDIGVTRALHKI